jgi:hypothetical protein
MSLLTLLGNVGPGPVVGGITPIGCIQREALSRAADHSVENISRLMEERKCEGNGALAAGAIMIFATPKLEGVEGSFGAFLVEGDRFGGCVRLPGEKRPLSNEVIMASNHFLKYGSVSTDLSDYSNPVVFGFRVRNYLCIFP